MGTINFLLPSDMREAAAAETERACLVGGQDHMPHASQACVQNGRLMLTRNGQESGQLLVPWEVPGFGRMMLRSATVMERPAPYYLSQELARGTINQIRGQVAEWLMGGMIMSSDLTEKVRQATLSFSKTLATSPSEVNALSQGALTLGCQAAEDLVAAYVQQVFSLRHQRQPKLDSLLGCRFNVLPGNAALEQQITAAFNAGVVQVPWSVIEATEGNLQWQLPDQIIDWMQRKNMTAAMGPLVDFSGYGLPDWLWSKDLDLTLLCDFLCEFIERVVQRYKGRVRHWQLTSGSNITGVVGRSDDELLWLTLRLIETARQVDASAEMSISLAQPFGDYLVQQDWSHSPPLTFADDLLRTGVKLTGLGLELLMGFDPRGSYCRPTLEASAILDLYAYLGIPLLVTLGYPSDSRPDPLADGDLTVNAGYWRDGCSPASQADWAYRFASLALCKPVVRGVIWAHADDGVPHRFPHAGLVDSQGKVKPALAGLTSLREQHLK